MKGGRGLTARGIIPTKISSSTGSIRAALLGVLLPSSVDVRSRHNTG